MKMALLKIGTLLQDGLRVLDFIEIDNWFQIGV